MFLRFQGRFLGKEYIYFFQFNPTKNNSQELKKMHLHIFWSIFIETGFLMTIRVCLKNLF